MKKFTPVFVLFFLMIGLTLLSLPQLAQANDPFVGEIIQYAGDTAPDGWLVTDGSAISRTLYSDLFSLIGTDYGSGDGSTTFNLPNVEGIPVGTIVVWPDYTTTIPSGWLWLNQDIITQPAYPQLYVRLREGNLYGSTGFPGHIYLPDTREKFVMGANGPAAYSTYVGKTGGEITHTLTITEMPSHNHSAEPGYTFFERTSGSLLITTQAGSASFDSTHSNTSLTGGGQPFDITNPYIAMNWIIKAKPDPNFIIYTGVYSSPTPTPTPTATPNAIYLPYIYTHTLGSGHELHVPVQASFGQLIISGVSLAIVAVGALWFIFGVVYR